MMKKDFSPDLVPATFDDYPVIQNMARFYVYDLSRDCGFISEDWNIPQDGLYESFDYRSYFEDSTRKPFLIKVAGELAGFVLLNNQGLWPDTQWNMGEFFILGKFQNKGIGAKVANQIWGMYPGLWELSVIPENKRALSFWRTAIAQFTEEKYQEEIKKIDYDPHQTNRHVFRFESKKKQKE